VAEGFQALGELLAGGIDREGARAEGRLAGAKSIDALHKARIRVDEAQQRLELEKAGIDAGMEPAQAKFMSTSFRAGAGNVKQSSEALSEQFELGVRKSILDDEDISIGEINRRRSAIAPGGLLDPIQFGPGGELAVELLGPDAGGIDITPTGKAQIGADVSLTNLRDEKRLHPEKFRAPGTTVNIGEGTLSEQLLADDGSDRISVIPEGFDAEEAFGAESFVTGGINAISDFFGMGNQFEAAAVANEVIGNLQVRTKTTMLALQNSTRTSKHLLDMFGTYAEKPRSLFRGDDQAVIRLENTIATARRFADRTAKLLDRAELKSTRDKLSKEFLAVSDLVTDYEDVLASITSGENEKVLQAAPELPDGWTVTTDGQSDLDDAE